ncbi:hypothetical protein Anas_08747 [Armadillidium nasatum]|uniref:Uncharacterized protein n=1 Tax=Armadillidium nasatum TaxID=96803 RepID=A0A5N5STC8_9CRUS|nr:hypothetical protein Anas_08747 [Armadillidium nasatum]
MIKKLKEKNIDLLLSPTYPIPAIQNEIAEAMTQLIDDFHTLNMSVNCETSSIFILELFLIK